MEYIRMKEETQQQQRRENSSNQVLGPNESNFNVVCTMYKLKLHFCRLYELERFQGCIVHGIVCMRTTIVHKE